MQEFIDYSLEWVRGEILEALVFGCFGLILLLCSALLWKFGSTENARVMVIPLAVPALILLLACASGVYSNVQRMSSFQQANAADSLAFVASEESRVRGFMPWYRYTVAGSAFACLLGLLLVVSALSATLQAIGFALLITGFSGLLIDFYSQERALLYLEYIEQQVRF